MGKILFIFILLFLSSCALDDDSGSEISAAGLIRCDSSTSNCLPPVAGERSNPGEGCSKNIYGGAKSPIQRALNIGDLERSKKEILAGKQTKGEDIGCPEYELEYTKYPTAKPTASDVYSTWTSNHKAKVDGLTFSCPQLGRSWASIGSTLALVNSNSFVSEPNLLINMAKHYLTTQYSPLNYSSTSPRRYPYGSFGIQVENDSSNECYRGDVAHASARTAYNSYNEQAPLTVVYDSGTYAGKRFLISDSDLRLNFVDGGLSYDHGWITSFFYEMLRIMDPGPEKTLLEQSFILASEWSRKHVAISNSNYTAKLVWNLALAYKYTGDIKYRDRMQEFLDLIIIPGILMDEDSDGKVDNTDILFKELHPLAQVPGRMWDSHNAAQWYQALNVIAITEAYVALRDKGDAILANNLKKYMIAVNDNLVNEVTKYGLHSKLTIGFRGTSYAILNSVWKVKQYENLDKPLWEKASWVLWNTKFFSQHDAHIASMPLLFKILNEDRYNP